MSKSMIVELHHGDGRISEHTIRERPLNDPVLWTQFGPLIRGAEAHPEHRIAAFAWDGTVYHRGRYGPIYVYRPTSYLPSVADDPDRLRRLYDRAIGKWGEGLQIDVAIEEMSELITELARHRRGRGKRAHVAEEIADARIMLEQLEIIYGCREEVSGYRRVKLERLERRLKD